MPELSELLNGWFTEAEAAGRLGGMNVRTLQRRYVERGLIEVRKRPRPGKKPETVCNPDDVQKFVPRAHVLDPQIDTQPDTQIDTRVQAPSPPLALVELIQAITAGIGAIQARREMAPVWFTLEQAAQETGLGRSVLKRLAKRVGPHRALRIHRKTLEAFEG